MRSRVRTAYSLTAVLGLARHQSDLAKSVRRRWSVASYGDVPATELDKIQEEYFAQVAQRDEAASLPAVTIVPTVNRQSRVRPTEHAGDNTGDATVASVHFDAPDDVVRTSPPPKPSVASFRASKRKSKRSSSSKKPPPTPTLPMEDPWADLRELLRRAGEVDFTTVDTQALSAAAPEDVASLRSTRDPTRGNRVDEKYRTNLSKATNHPAVAAPHTIPATQTLVAATSVLLPVRRFDEEALMTQQHAIARAEVDSASDAALEAEKTTLAPSDAVTVWNFDARMKQQALRFYQRNPVGHMITTPLVRITRLLDKTTGKMNVIPMEEQETIPVRRARRLAAELGLDLIQSLMINGTYDKPSIALCILADAGSAVLDDLQFTSHISTTTAVWTKENIEVGFTGGTEAWAITFKSREIARFLYKRHQVRIVLTKFGTAREGFPVFESILQRISEEAERFNKTHFTTGRLQSSGNSIWCVLHPTTDKAPLSATTRPTESQLKSAMDRAMYDEQFDREVVIPREIKPHEAKNYNWMKKTGTDWTYRSPGLTLQKLRKLKLFQAWIPKSNRHLYAARGDVELNSKKGNFRQFKTFDYQMSTHTSNLEKASRAAAVLGARSRMSVTDMYDEGETEGHTSTIASLRYMGTGDALKLGAFKETIGVKRNRTRGTPRPEKGFATEGVEEPDVRRGNQTV